jgi:hypothetical protein
MADQVSPSVPEVRARLQDAARKVRESDSLDPNVRQSLSDLMDELGRALDSSQTPPAEVARLADGTAHLAESLERGHDRGLVETARERLRQLIIDAETRAPVAVTLAERMIDALAKLGI